MTTLAVTGLRLAGTALVQIAKSYAISAATGAISRTFDDRNFEGPRLDSFHLQTSRDGAPMARVYGRARLAGQVIWASALREVATQSAVRGGKGGGPTRTDYAYTISFAIGLCEGEILGVDRLWANGAPLETRGLTLRTHTGSDTQLPDPVIAATEGPNAPAFRGTAYLVFEDFPLTDFGARLPQINAEVIRSLDGDTLRLERLVKSVNLLPGSGEYAYSPTVVEETPEPGFSLPVNMNNLSGQSDFDLAIEQLRTQLPNCRHVSIISAWFGDSLDCAMCRIRPGIERRRRTTPDRQWSVAGYKRDTAWLISTDRDGRPNYGGTPDDQSLIDAIQALKQDGFSVTLYPFLMMDMPAETTTSGAFPWRGRVTATQDRTDATRTAVSRFFNGVEGYRDFILAHAELAKRAGGVDRFVIGSEMKGLTHLRDANDAFPAVEEFMRLATDVDVVVGSQTGITYAADWSEYFGYHPQDGSDDVYFNLDPLWAHPSISAIGIDAYFPLSDWREGGGVDAANAPNIYDPDYLRKNVEGGEGYDWYYVSQADRDAQIRSPLTDWVYRNKDLRNWWTHPHYDRRSGVAVAAPSVWQPQSKPFWLTEVGCPAVRFGANQPNVFPDPKSVDGATPYYSDGSRDDLMQRAYLEALIGYWDNPDTNPVSDNGVQMVDTDAVSVWAWDARPYPDFPARLDVWSDGQN